MEDIKKELKAGFFNPSDESKATLRKIYNLKNTEENFPEFCNLLFKQLDRSQGKRSTLSNSIKPHVSRVFSVLAKPDNKAMRDKVESKKIVDKSGLSLKQYCDARSTNNVKFTNSNALLFTQALSQSIPFLRHPPSDAASPTLVLLSVLLLSTFTEIANQRPKANSKLRKRSLLSTPAAVRLAPTPSPSR